MADRVAFPHSPLSRRICAIAAGNGFEARIVGGAVRDFLLGNPGGDIDMAVNTPIASAATAFVNAGLRVLETGLAHGTVTVLDPAATEAGGIEVTQTRVDVDTDGRHATVAFSGDWLADAERRDFTINAIYICADGTLFDPLSGQADLAANRLRFVGAADQRVREDALRMLRYCRFLPAFGAGRADPDAVAALSAHAGLSAGLSGERLASELRRIFAAPGAATAVGLMRQTGLDEAAFGVGLDPANLHFLPPAESFATDYGIAWLAGLAIAMPPEKEAVLAERLRLGRRERRCLTLTMSQAGLALATGLTQAHWQEAAWAVARTGAAPALVYAVAAARAGWPVDPEQCARLATWTGPECPVSGTDLLSHGVDNGVAVGQELERIEQRWAASGFTLTREELLADL